MVVALIFSEDLEGKEVQVLQLLSYLIIQNRTHFYCGGLVALTFSVDFVPRDTDLVTALNSMTDQS